MTTNVQSLEISRSQISTFQRCRNRYRYLYIDKIPQGTPSVAMSLGTIGHAGLAAGYEVIQRLQTGTQTHLSGAELREAFVDAAHTAMRRMIQSGVSTYRGEEQPLGVNLDDHAKEFQTMLDVIDYYALAQVESDFLTYKVLGIEQEIHYSHMFSVADDVFFTTLSGIADLVVEHIPTGRLGIVDHKFPGVIGDALRFLAVDTQMLTYEVVAAHYGAWQWNRDTQEVDLIYNMLRREVPPGFGSRSATTKNGSASRASTNPKDYLDRVTLYHSPKERQAIESNLQATIRDMVKTGLKEGPWTLSPISTGGDSCLNCPVFARCQAGLIGHGTPRIGDLA